MKTAIHAATTAAGIILAIWAVYQGVRLDWPEMALIAGAGLIVYGGMWVKEFVDEVTKEER